MDVRSSDDRGNVRSCSIPAFRAAGSGCAGRRRAGAARCRVLTFSLCDEPTSGVAVRSSAGSTTTWSRSRTALRPAGVRKRSSIGVSYSGLIATEFAARHPGARPRSRAGLGAAARVDSRTGARGSTCARRGC